LPSIRKIGQMKSFGESVFSDTSRRDQSWRLSRRMRKAGNDEADVMRRESS
jgi:hypothetical protein